MRQLDEKVQLLHGKLMAISKRGASNLSHSDSNIERRMDEGGGQVQDRLKHLVQRLVDLRGWVLMRWGGEPCHALPHAHEEGQDEGYDATRAGSHQDHEIMWVGID